MQTTHVAAQYGQTAFLYHIVSKWNADPDVPDNDGRSPLHWYMRTSTTPLLKLLKKIDHGIILIVHDTLVANGIFKFLLSILVLFFFFFSHFKLLFVDLNIFFELKFC